jgi:hypothetical protein
VKKINGHELIECDYVGEIGKIGDTKLIRSACDVFLCSRGIPTHSFNPSFGKGLFRPHPRRVGRRRAR